MQNWKQLVGFLSFILLLTASTAFGVQQKAHAQAGVQNCIVNLVTQAPDDNPNAPIEHHFICDQHHFMSLIEQDGALVFRPHPGGDVDGWGSSWYAQPFLSGSEPQHGVVDVVEVTANNFHVELSGQVPRSVSQAHGVWDLSLDFTYDPANKKIIGLGHYLITLDAPLNTVSADLNLYRIASNFLDQVPLCSGSVGNTGDMLQANVSGTNPTQNFTWIPSEKPGHFPSDQSTQLTIDVSGAHYNVDTVAQGYARIEPAFKPSLKVTLSSTDSNGKMSFGGFYDTAKRKQFWEDNVGITPLILQSTSATQLDFSVNFESQALPEDTAPIPSPSEPLRATDIFWYGSGARFDALWIAAAEHLWEPGQNASNYFTYRPVRRDRSFIPLVGNFDGDDTSDIFWYSPGPSFDALWFTNCEGNSFKYRPVTLNGTFDPIVGDFNNDGLDDIFWYGPGADFDAVWLAEGSRDCEPEPDCSANHDYFDYHPVKRNGIFEPFAGDFNGDGFDDIFWYGVGARFDAIWLADGHSNWPPNSSAAAHFTYHPVRVDGTFEPVVGDFNRDGLDDIFWYGVGTAADMVWLAAGEGSFVQHPVTIDRVFTPLSGDFNGDGFDDIFWYGFERNFDAIWLADGKDTWLPGTNANNYFTYYPVRINGAFAPFTGDFNGTQYGSAPEE